VSILTEFPELNLTRELKVYNPKEIKMKINNYYSKLEAQQLLLSLFKCLIAFRNLKLVFGLKFHSNSNKVIYLS